jgi:hypothetical protein
MAVTDTTSQIAELLESVGNWGRWGKEDQREARTPTGTPAPGNFCDRPRACETNSKGRQAKRIIGCCPSSRMTAGATNSPSTAS